MGRVLICPECGSHNVRVDVKKEFSFGKFVVGTALFGPLGGAIAGATGKDSTVAVCQSCGFHGSIKHRK